MNIKNLVFNLLDERIGGEADCFNDYEDKESILNYAIEIVQEEDDLTQGCGVGPLIDHIEEWVDNLEKLAQNKDLSLSSKVKKI